MAENVELLFFDTFSHESCEEINLDLVQFPKPVLLSELRIIPLGARVQADFPGGVRLGATNPSQFRIEFFVNDLSKAPGAAVFEALGALDYNQNGNIRMELSHRPIPTDGLVLRGWYSTITLAVYGCLTKTIQEQATVNQSALPSSTISTNSRAPGPEVTTSATAEWVQQHAQVGTTPADHNVSTENEEFEGKYPNPPTTHYPYQEDWPSSAPASVVNLSDGYNHVKNEPPYENSQAEWSEDKGFWDEDKDKEARHRDRISPPMEISRDLTTDFRERGSDDGRLRDREYYSSKSSSSQFAQVHSSWMEWEGLSSRKRPRSPPVQPRTPPPEDSNSGSVKKECNSPAFETFSPGDVESISDGEISEPGENDALKEEKTPPPPVETITPKASPQPPEIDLEQSTTNTEQFEPILSDEDIPDEIDVQDIDFEFADFADNPLKVFNPYAFIVQPLSYLSDPSMSEYEWKVSHCSEEYLKFKKVPEATQLEEVFNNCDDFSDCKKESWVIGIEKLVPLIPKGLPHSESRESIIETLISWVDTGLNFEDALTQPQPAFKIRHIKAGLRLAEVLCKCSEQITLDLIERISLHRKLIDLYHIEYMALSIKLMILRTLDSSLRYKSCVELFLNSEIFSVNDENMNENVNGYVKIVDMMQRDQLARVKFALASLLRKFHIYEILSEFNQLIYNYDKKLKSKDGDTPEEFDMNLISICLEEIIKYYKNAQTMISHPKRFLPVHSQFDFGATFSCPEPYETLFTFFKSHLLIETIVLILNSPEMASDWSLLLLIQEFISSLIETPEGMRFLCSSIDTINPIIKILIGTTTPPTVDENEVVSLGINIPLGLTLVYRLQALNYTDILFNFWEYQSVMKLDPDSSEILDILHNLHCLTMHPIGKSAVVFILSRCDYIQPVLNFLKFHTKPEDTTNSKKKSPSILYASDLISTVVKFSDYVPFLRKYGPELCDMIAKEPQLPELQALVPWLKPSQNYSLFHYEDISDLCELVKKNLDSCTSQPGELITGLRILRQLGVQTNDKDLHEVSDPLKEEYVESKYKYVILQLYSYDGMSFLTSILQKFIEHYDEPYLNSHKFLQGNSVLVLSIIMPCVQLLRRMLIYVIQCQNTDFKDLTAIPILLSIYNLMCFVPASSHAYFEAQKVRKDIVDTLLAYTLPISNETSSESEALNKSLWTSMIKEVIKFITASPYTFQNGLLILSELLPLPLPIQTKESLSESEISRIVNYRKLWSAHLHSLSQLLQDLIVTLCESSYQPLLHILRKICVQLSDLAAPTALIVVRSILDALFSSLSLNQNVAPVTPRTVRLLNFLACLLTYPCVKVAFLHLTVNNASVPKSEEKFLTLMDTLCLIISTPSDDVNHLQAQECVLSMFQALCCADITLLPRLNDPSLTLSIETYLSNSLPPKQTLVPMCLALLDHLSLKENSLTTTLQILRILLTLSEHDFGIYHLKNCFESKNKAVFCVLTKLAECWSKNILECVPILMVLIELFKELSTPVVEVKSENDEGCGLLSLGHSITLSPKEIAELCLYKRPSEVIKMEVNGDSEVTETNDIHPFHQLSSIIKANNADLENFPGVEPSFSEFMKLLDDSEIKPPEKKEPIVEPILPHCDPILVQFMSRPVSVMLGSVDDDRLTPAYWLSAPPVSEEADQEMEQIPCDILELAKNCFPKMNFLEELENLCKSKISSTDVDQSPTLKKRAKEKLQSSSVGSTPTSTSASSSSPAETKAKKPFVTPMRGRGASTSRSSSQQQRGDLFRTRLPNTSRPPSLHVDDFVALETCGQQPTGPTGYNKMSMRAAQDLRVRGRARAFGLDRGARFFGALSFRPRPGWHHLMPRQEGGGPSGQPPLPHAFRGHEPHLRPPFRGGRSLWEQRPFPPPGMRGVLSHRSDARLLRPFPR
ncbi:unnamed protein product [Bemisia tabaci]|uniref:Virilizer N-terminal domain-containing protein n=1 Tax=Bemisia tabaci TaxID=7038 RepID=A0A9P0F2N0_BEMTA|nr:unnamed protein product [Bemisia tabaci]